MCNKSENLQQAVKQIVSRKTWVCQHQKGKPFWILMKLRMMGWHWHQLYHMQIIFTLLKTYNHASPSPLSFLRAGCSSCCPSTSVRALKAVFQTRVVYVVQVITLKLIVVMFLNMHIMTNHDRTSVQCVRNHLQRNTD